MQVLLCPASLQGMQDLSPPYRGGPVTQTVLKLQQTGIGMGQAQLEYFLGFSDSRPWLCVMLSMSVLTELSL